jgi:hypothetical protein
MYGNMYHVSRISNNGGYYGCSHCQYGCERHHDDCEAVAVAGITAVPLPTAFTGITAVTSVTLIFLFKDDGSVVWMTTQHAIFPGGPGGSSEAILFLPVNGP